MFKLFKSFFKKKEEPKIKGVSFKIFQVFQCRTEDDLKELAKKHHKENPENTVQDYLNAFTEALKIKNKIARQV